LACDTPFDYQPMRNNASTETSMINEEESIIGLDH
jgi:hypothetical protein